MKNRFISIVIIISLFCLTFNCINVTAESSNNSLDNNQIYYHYDAKTNKVTQFTHKELKERNSPLKSTSISSEDTDVLSIPEYVPEHLPREVPSQPEERVLLGSWTEINPATSGQHRNTVYISYRKNGNNCRASGFMIGPAAVVTSGHVLYSGGNYATNIVVTPARADSSTPYGSAEYSGIVVNSDWVDDGNSNYDWGIIELETNIGDNVGWLGLETKLTSYNNQSIKINGYPGEVKGETKQTMYRTSGTICSSKTYKLLSDDTNTIDGMSGGPLYYYSSDTGYTAIGLVKGAENGKNSFIRFTRSLYNLLVSYRDYRA